MFTKSDIYFSSKNSSFILGEELRQKYLDSKDCLNLVGLQPFKVFSRFDTDANCAITKEEYLSEKISEFNEGI